MLARLKWLNNIINFMGQAQTESKHIRAAKHGFKPSNYEGVVAGCIINQFTGK